MERSTSYLDLVAWQQAMDLVTLTCEFVKIFPDDERFGLTSQLRRAVFSIPSNIAEGQGRESKGEFIQFLGNARGSLYEVETQILIAERLKYAPKAEVDALLVQANKVSKLINGLMRALKASVKSASVGMA